MAVTELRVDQLDLLNRLYMRDLHIVASENATLFCDIMYSYRYIACVPSIVFYNTVSYWLAEHTHFNDWYYITESVKYPKFYILFESQELYFRFLLCNNLS